MPSNTTPFLFVPFHLPIECSLLKCSYIIQFFHLIIRVAAENVSIDFGVSFCNICQLSPNIFLPKFLCLLSWNPEMLHKKSTSKVSDVFWILWSIFGLSNKLLVFDQNSNFRISVTQHASIIDVCAPYYHF